MKEYYIDLYFNNTVSNKLDTLRFTIRSPTFLIGLITTIIMFVQEFLRYEECLFYSYSEVLNETIC